MSLPLIIKSSAQHDIDDAHDWYEEQGTGRGDQFLDELRDRLKYITLNPHMFGRLRGQVRAAPVLKSKFVIYYRIKVDSITVIAVQHMRADPRKLRGR